MFSRLLAGAVLVASSMIGSAALAVPVVGVAVDGIGSSTTVGITVNKPDLGGDAIEYFIPLTASPATCVFGVNCGTTSDVGNGGTKMSMFLRFDPVSTVYPSTLNVYFEDLDLIGVNDPANFLESIEIFNKDGVSLTGLIDDIASPLVTGNSYTQQLLTFALGILPESPFFAEFVFASDYDHSRAGRNTPEYLRAEIISTVPVPAAGLMLLTAMGGFAALRRRKRA